MSANAQLDGIERVEQLEGDQSIPASLFPLDPASLQDNIS